MPTEIMPLATNDDTARLFQDAEAEINRQMAKWFYPNGREAYLAEFDAKFGVRDTNAELAKSAQTLVDSKKIWSYPNVRQSSLELVTPETLKRDAPVINAMIEKIGADVFNSAFNALTDNSEASNV